MMKITLKTFEIFVACMLGFGLVGMLSILPQVRWMAYFAVVASLFFLWQIEEEKKRRKKKVQFYKKMEKIIARRLQESAQIDGAHISLVFVTAYNTLL